MLNSLLYLDQQVFFFINHTCSNEILDWILPWWRHRLFWIPLYAFIIYYLPKMYHKKGWWMLASLILTFAISDTLSSHIIKPWVARIRPCNDPLLSGMVNSLVGCGSGYSFPSSHATNHFAIALHLVWILPQWNKKIFLWAIAWASSIALAQVYVGVHYPIDIFCGSLLGIFIAYLCASFFKKLIS